MDIYYFVFINKMREAEHSQQFLGPVDADSDGLTSTQERELGTSDYNADFEGDGLIDGNDPNPTQNGNFGGEGFVEWINENDSICNSMIEEEMLECKADLRSDDNHNGFTNAFEEFVLNSGFVKEGYNPFDFDGDGESNLKEIWQGTDILDADDFLRTNAR